MFIGSVSFILIFDSRFTCISRHFNLLTAYLFVPATWPITQKKRKQTRRGEKKREEKRRDNTVEKNKNKTSEQRAERREEKRRQE